MNFTKPEGRYAAIYIRTSSEHQAEKSSPEEQETDCRKLATEQNLQVVAVYKDVEKFRVKRRLVDPSGTRADRPGLLSMLNDAATGHFDTILAWREDRLYRGMRAMLIVLETIQDHKINVILAKETFDARMAPIKAWVAQMELEGMRERMTMGVKARLRNGKANTGQDRYGYQRFGEVIEVVEEEAHWVRQIFDWYVNGVRIHEIRRRLIEAGAPQKGSSIPRKIRWARSTIQSIFKAAKEYAFGIKIQRRCGEEFQISVPPIIDQETYQRFLEMRKTNKTYPSHHLKREYLIGGMLYCECGRRWGSRAASYTRRARNGEKVERKTIYGAYYCPQQYLELRHPDCTKTIGSKKADEIVWGKVVEAINKPDVLMSEARRHVAELKNHADDITAEQNRFQEELNNLREERQWVITNARKGRISDDDMEIQLAQIAAQELLFKQELSTQDQFVQLSEINNWEEAALEYLEDLKVGLQSLDAAPQSDEEQHEIFLIKRRIVQTLVEKVMIYKERELKVVIKLNILTILKGTDRFNEIQSVGTYTHTPESLARPHPAGSCV
jgi:site-specific DNA recombinase